jgi:ArsR family transcriptional regulator, arsenate/arsenite/antimonite-responsive transcriptional repressor
MPTLEAIAPAADTCTTAECAPLAQERIDAAGAQRLATALKAIADPARLRVVSYIAAAPEQNVCVGDLVDLLELSQGTVSHHLKILVDAGFLTRSKQGTFSYYALVRGPLDDLSRVLLT